jgi:hypothetical protein
MCDFSTATSTKVLTDPNQRVRYPLGIVLGVDEFEQEQAYFLGRGRQHNRVQHGYGTVYGLKLSAEEHKVRVTPGLAVDPRGRVIELTRDICGDLDVWLGSAENRKKLGTGNGPFRLYVTLGYRECLTNKVPIPGAPCRSEEDTMDFSRITELSCLKFATVPPPAVEAEGERRLARLLSRIQISDSGFDFLDEEEMAGCVRSLIEAGPASSPPSSPPDSLLSSPPGGPLLVRPENAERVMQAACRTWTTEVRPVLLDEAKRLMKTAEGSDRILLGWVDFTVTIDNKVAAGLTIDAPDPDPDGPERPWLLHTRLLQELMARRFSDVAQGAMELAGDVTGEIWMNTVRQIQGVPVSPDNPANGQLLTFINGHWRPDNPPYKIISAGIFNIEQIEKKGKKKPKESPPVPLPFYGQKLMLALVPDESYKPRNGCLWITFKGYQEPTEKHRHNYVVKVLPFCDAEARNALKLTAPVVVLDQFAARGIQLWVTDGGEPIAVDILSQMQFEIEISHYLID